jgi:hypothetical protein
MTDDTRELFDPEFLGQLRQLFFKLRRRRRLNKRGLQSTPSAGITREFKDHRQYSPGDDYRTIDWRIYARLERMFIRIFEEVQEFHVHILIDRSRSMYEPFGEKRVVALRLAVALAYLSLINQHRVSLMSIGDAAHREMPPLKGQGHINEILRALSMMEFAGQTNLVDCLKQFRPGRDRRGIVFVVSDLFGQSPELAKEALHQARMWPAETHVIQIMHPMEMDPQLEGEIRLIDVETNEIRRIWLNKRDMVRYKQAFEEWLEDIGQTCQASQLNHVPWTTDLPFEEMFINLLSRGSALTGS